MLSYSKLSGRPAIFRSFTGLDVPEFDSVYVGVEEMYDEFEARRLSRDKRRRVVGAGRPFKLSLRDRLLMLLIHYRLYITSTLAGYLFDIDQSNVLKDIRMIEPLVKECVPLPKKVHTLTGRLRTVEEVEKYFPGFRAFIDATEQEIPRPSDRKKRRSHYSGKKRKHTVKTQITVNNNGLIVHRTNHARGRRHDYDIFKSNHPSLPPQVSPGVDLGYDGIQNDFPELNVVIPFKRRRNGKELTDEQKRYNMAQAKARVVVEHTIARMKKFRIISEEFRNRLKRYDVMTDIVSGLVNLRIIGTATV